MNYIQVKIITSSEEQSDILIAELSGNGFDAFEQSTEGANHILSAYTNEKNYDEENLANILSSYNVTFKSSIIPETNWNEKWESDFEPIIVGSYVCIRAGFHKPVKNVAHDIIITPKMSFGTGHHDTTYMMLEQMQALDIKEKTVMDFGTGTGVLAILARKAGAARVLAIDNDEWSITNAAENISANKCNGIELQQRNDPGVNEKFDVVLANINLNVIINHTAELVNISKEGTQLLLSGFLFSDEDRIKENFNKEGFVHMCTSRRNDWICMLLTNPQ